VPSGTPPYQTNLFDKLPHREGYWAATASSTDTYRRALAAADANSVDIICVGYATALSALLSSSADAISGLTGIQLVTAKVRNLWVMGGQWPAGQENNFNRDTTAAAAANALVTSWPSTVPITFLGYESGATVLTGQNLNGTAAVDPVAQALSDYGAATSGRPSWDPMLTWLACLGDVTAAGYTSVQGTASVNATTGVNSWTNGSGGPHRYVVKAQQDPWYTADLNSRLLPGRDPAPAVLPGVYATKRSTPVLRTPVAASFSRPVRNTDANLVVQYHADDLADLADASAVPHLDDRVLVNPARQLTSASRPTVTTIGSRRCLAFASGQWLFSEALILPSTLTIYALVRWATLPTSIQTLFAADSLAAPNQRVFHVTANSSAALLGIGFNGLAGQVDTGPVATINTWQVVAVRITPTSIETYLDGASAGGATTFSAQNSGRAQLAIGSRYYDASSEPFVGYLRDLRIYAASHDAATIGTNSTAINV
jgi:hypothetical protein